MRKSLDTLTVRRTTAKGQKNTLKIVVPDEGNNSHQTGPPIFIPIS